MNKFLSLVMLKLRNDFYQNYDCSYNGLISRHTSPTMYNGKPYDLPFLEIGTKDCKHAEFGGCTMCNFGKDEKINENKIIKQLEIAFEICRKKPFVHMAVCGSTFDDWEFSPLVRKKMFELANKCGYLEYFGTESRPEDITPEKLEEAKSILGDIKLSIGIGFESSNFFIRECCVNKGLKKGDFLTSVNLLKKYNIDQEIHVILKPPFLTEKEAIEDSIKTIKYVINELKVYVIFIPVNMRIGGTLTKWLNEKGLYNIPMLWSVLEVIMALSEKELEKFIIPAFESSYTLQQVSENCDKCTRRIRELILNFQYTKNKKFIEGAMNIKCGCKDIWKERLKEKALPLRERIIKNYEFIAKEILGNNWWIENKNWVVEYVRCCSVLNSKKQEKSKE